MRRLTYSFGSLAALSMLAACALQPPAAPPSMNPAPVVSAFSPQPGQATGAVTLNVVWPQRRVQYIQPSATKLVFNVFTVGGSTPLMTQTLTYPNAQVTLQPLPIGNLVFTGSALDADNSVGATGSVTVNVLPNVATPGVLTLASTCHPAIGSVSPANAVPGTVVRILGSGFLGYSTNASYSVSFGGVVQPSTQFNRVSDTEIDFTLPTTATNSTLAVAVGGAIATNATVVQAIKQVSVFPASVTLSPSTPTASVTATASDYAGNPISNPNLNWNYLTSTQNCPTCGTSKQVVAMSAPTIDATSSVVTLTANASGSVQVSAGFGPATAAASVTVN